MWQVCDVEVWLFTTEEDFHATVKRLLFSSLRPAACLLLPLFLSYGPFQILKLDFPGDDLWELMAMLSQR